MEDIQPILYGHVPICIRKIQPTISETHINKWNDC